MPTSHAAFRRALPSGTVLHGPRVSRHQRHLVAPQSTAFGLYPNRFATVCGSSHRDVQEDQHGPVQHIASHGDQLRLAHPS